EIAPDAKRTEGCGSKFVHVPAAAQACSRLDRCARVFWFDAWGDAFIHPAAGMATLRPCWRPARAAAWRTDGSSRFPPTEANATWEDSSGWTTSTCDPPRLKVSAGAASAATQRGRN